MCTLTKTKRINSFVSNSKNNNERKFDLPLTGPAIIKAKKKHKKALSICHEYVRLIDSRYEVLIPRSQGQKTKICQQVTLSIEKNV